MARDDIFPFSNHLRWVFERTKAPLASTLLVFIIDSLFLLLQLVSTDAFKNLLSLTTLGYQISYFMPIFFRCTFARNRFPVGDFYLGRFGVPIGVISCIWLFVTSLLALFPTKYPVDKDNMNYAIVIIAGVGCIAAVHWFASARHRFVGPKITDIDPVTMPFNTIASARSVETMTPAL
jgi:choline transport protein